MRCKVALLSCLLVLACHRSGPTGQILARIDGTDITLRDLGGEPASGTARQAAIETLIDRLLLVQEAKRRALDQTPQFLAAQRRDRDLLLVRMLSDRVARFPPPDDAAISNYIRDRPQRYADRHIMVIDRVSVIAAAPVQAAIQQATSNDALASRLLAMGHKVDRDTVVIDTARLTREAADAASDLIKGRLHISIIGDTLVSEMLVGSIRVPMPREQSVRDARVALSDEAADTRLAALVLQLRSTAQIARFGAR